MSERYVDMHRTLTKALQCFRDLENNGEIPKATHKAYWAAKEVRDYVEQRKRRR